MIANVNYFLKSKHKIISLGLVREVLAVLIGMAVFIGFLGPTGCNLEGLYVEAALVPSFRGQTVVELPPLGTLTMNTHPTPLEFRLTLRSIHPDLLETDFPLAAGDLWRRLAPATGGALLYFLGKQLLLGALGAALATRVLLRAPPLKCGKSAAAGFFAAGALLAATWATYDLEAAREPKFNGILAFAPQMLALADETMAELSDFRDKATQLAGNMQHLLSQIEQMNLVQAPAASDIKLLLVSRHT